jgi:TonB family protein
MASQAPQKILRVGVLQNGRIIEERLLRPNEPVTLGSRLNNTISVTGSAVIPASVTLFDVKGGKYALHFTDAMSGKIAVGGVDYELGSLKQAGKAKSGGGTWSVELDDKSRGKVSIDDVTVLFQLVAAPPVRALPQLPANMRGGMIYFVSGVLGLTGTFVATMLLSALIQGGGLAYVYFFVPPPPRQTGIAAIPDRLIQIMMPPEEPEEEEEAPAEVVEEGTGIPTEEAEEEAEAEAEEEAPEEEAPVRSQDTIREEARTRVVQESALSAFYGSNTGSGPVMAITNLRSSGNAEDVIATQGVLGANQGGITSSLGAGTSAGAEGGVDRAAIDTSGQSAVAAAATVERTEQAATATVRVRIRDEAARTAGSGSLDEGEINDVLRRGQRDVERCYERELAQDPALGGRVVVEFTIGSDGRVGDPRLRTNELNDAFENCVLGRVRAWRFPPPEGGSVAVQKTWVLQNSSE